MLFEVERQSYQRVVIQPAAVCQGCVFLGVESAEPPFCLMEEDPARCRVAKALGKYSDETGGKR